MEQHWLLQFKFVILFFFNLHKSYINTFLYLFPSIDFKVNNFNLYIFRPSVIFDNFLISTHLNQILYAFSTTVIAQTSINHTTHSI